MPEKMICAYDYGLQIKVEVAHLQLWDEQDPHKAQL